MGTPDARIALLVDAENAPAPVVEPVLADLADRGVVTVRRAYGNWTSPGLGPWVAALRVHAIRPVQQFAYTRGKNAADIALVIDALDLLHGGCVDAFALVSSDADFTPLVLRLLDGGVPVYGFGEPKAPEPFVRSCTRFTHLSGPVPAGIVRSIRTAVAAVRRDDGWADLGTVGALASLDLRAHGYRRLSKLVEATGQFDLRREDLAVLVREKRPA